MNNSVRNLVCRRLAFLSAAWSSLAVALGQGDPAAFNPGVPWPATDALGRRLPVPSEVGRPRPDRFVGIFYFLWHDNRGGKSPNWDGPYDIAQDSEARSRCAEEAGFAAVGPDRHVSLLGRAALRLLPERATRGCCAVTRMLLADAGIDTLIFDTTNRSDLPRCLSWSSARSVARSGKKADARRGSLSW